MRKLRRARCAEEGDEGLALLDEFGNPVEVAFACSSPDVAHRAFGVMRRSEEMKRETVPPRLYRARRVTTCTDGHDTLELSLAVTR